MKLQSHNFNPAINNKQLKREFCIKYLGILIDLNLNWKDQVECIAKKILLEEALVSSLNFLIFLIFY